MANGERRTGGRRNSDPKRIRSTAVLDMSSLQSSDIIVTVEGKDVEAPGSFGPDLNQHYMAQLAVSEEGSVTKFKH